MHVNLNLNWEHLYTINFISSHFDLKLYDVYLQFIGVLTRFSKPGLIILVNTMKQQQRSNEFTNRRLK